MAIINKTRVGEALCGVGHELAHVDLLIGPRGSSAEMAFANCLTNNQHGFTSLLSVVAPNLAARPHSVMFNKVTIRNGRQAVQMFGPAQRGVAMAIADAVHEGVIPLSEADHVFIAVGVFIHWLAEDDVRIQDFNYEATKLAIRRAVNGDPKILEVLRQKELQKHPLADHK